MEQVSMIIGLIVLLTVALTAPAGLLADDSEQRAFPTPQAAVAALVSAAKASDFKDALTAVLGPDAEKILSSGDGVEDDNARKQFVSAYDQVHRLAFDADGRVTLYVGADDWPLPISLVKKGSGWVFDTAAAEQELVYRRIGANELYTIDVLENLVEAQNEYAEQMRDRTGVAQYAQKILSEEGKHDGLYWSAADGSPESPIGPRIAEAASEGYRKGQRGQPIPFHGYIYSVLKAQGKSATGGATSYVRNGRMTRGFAFRAYPADYRSSGVMTFVVNQEGVVMQKDLGPDTARLAAAITAYDPDSSWQQAAEPDEVPPEETPPAEAQDLASQYMPQN